MVPHATAFWRGASNTPTDPEIARKVLLKSDRIFGFTGMGDGTNIMSSAYGEATTHINAWGGTWQGKSMGITLPLGTLVREGYLTTPELLKCNDLDRSYFANSTAYGGPTPIYW